MPQVIYITPEPLPSPPILNPVQESSSPFWEVHFLPNFLLTALLDVWERTILLKKSTVTLAQQSTECTVNHLKGIYSHLAPKAIYFSLKLFDIFFPPILAIIVGVLVFALLKASLELGFAVGNAIRSFGVSIGNQLLGKYKEMRGDIVEGQTCGTCNVVGSPEVYSQPTFTSGHYHSPGQYHLSNTSQGNSSTAVRKIKSGPHRSPKPTLARNQAQVSEPQGQGHNRDQVEYQYQHQHQYQQQDLDLNHAQQQKEKGEDEYGNGNGDEDNDELSIWQDWIFALRWGILPRWSIWPQEITEVFEHDLDTQKRAVQQGTKSGELVILPYRV